MAKLILPYDPTEPYDKALIETAMRGHHSKCYFGEKAKLTAALSGDDGWNNPRPKVMPERGQYGVVRFSYRRIRYEQRLTRKDREWLDNFDMERAVGPLVLVLDTRGERTRPVDVVGKKSGTSPEGRKPTGCRAHSGNNSGRAKRLAALTAATIQAQREHGINFIA